jgi:hypothetical protein
VEYHVECDESIVALDAGRRRITKVCCAIVALHSSKENTMLPVYAAYLKELESLYTGIAKAIDGLPPEALDWVPAPGMNSICVLITHTTGAQRFLVGDMIGDIPSNRVRQAEFEAKGLDQASLTAMLGRAMSVTRDALEKATVADLESTEPRSKDGRSFTVAFALYHALAHSGEHLGHIEMTRQMWDARR